MRVLAALGSWALAHVGIPYDYNGLLSSIFGRISTDARRFICSEYCQMAYESAGLIRPTGKTLRPGEFLATGLFEPGRIILDTNRETQGA